MKDGSYAIPVQYLFIDTVSLLDTSLDVVRVLSTFGIFKTVDKRSGRVFSYGATYMSPFREGVSRVYLGGYLTTKNVVREECIGTIYQYLAGVDLRAEDVRRLRNNLQRNRQSNPDGYMMCTGGQWALIGGDGRYVIHPSRKKEERIAYLEGIANGYTIFRKDRY